MNPHSEWDSGVLGNVSTSSRRGQACSSALADPHDVNTAPGAKCQGLEMATQTQGLGDVGMLRVRLSRIASVAEKMTQREKTLKG